MAAKDDSFLTESQQKLMMELCSKEAGQSHLFKNWFDVKDGVSTSVIVQMAVQLESLNEAYPGGLKEYIIKAKQLLSGRC
jgi:hypothetical protein